MENRDFFLNHHHFGPIVRFDSDVSAPPHFPSLTQICGISRVGGIKIELLRNTVCHSRRQR
jgi:hypothetical protein